MAGKVPGLFWVVVGGFYFASTLVWGQFGALVEQKRRDDLYDRAISLRTSQGVTADDYRLAARLLAEAAGVRLPGLAWTEFPEPVEPSQLSGEPLPGFPDVVVPAQTHAGALRELGKALQDGRGVVAHQQLALELYRRAAELGDPEAQGHMAVRYAMGLQENDSVTANGVNRFGEVDEAQAILHYFFAAAGGDAAASMALGYRHLHGQGVPKNCMTAVAYYQPVAEAVVDATTRADSLPHIERIRLSVQDSLAFKVHHHKDTMMYFESLADRGNIMAQRDMGQVYNLGTYGVTRDHAQALHYLNQAAEAGDPSAMSHLGHMYANGLGTEKNLTAAKEWFTRGAEKGSGSSLFALGYLYFTGEGGLPLDHELAFKHFSQAAELDSPDALYYLGLMHLKGLGGVSRSLEKAVTYFLHASQYIHSQIHTQAIYQLAMLLLNGRGVRRDCRAAARYLKQLAELSPAASVLQQGHEHFFKGRYTQALLSYLRAAELGMELGQSNAAWMLDKGYGHTGPNTASVAFRLYSQSADQGNVASLVLMGDSYFYGEGVDQDWVRAAAVYYEAYAHQNAEAMFNIGFMHEFGAGVPKDLALARRYYEMAGVNRRSAYLAVTLAQCWLSLHEFWDSMLPYVPAKLSGVWSRVFALESPHTSVVGSVLPAVAHSLMPKQLALYWETLTYQVLDSTGLVDANWGELQDLGESLLLLVLLIMLIVVLRSRGRRAPPRGNWRNPGALDLPGGPGVDGLGGQQNVPVAHGAIERDTTRNVEPGGSGARLGVDGEGMGTPITTAAAAQTEAETTAQGEVAGGSSNGVRGGHRTTEDTGTPAAEGFSLDEPMGGPERSASEPLPMEQGSR